MWIFVSLKLIAYVITNSLKAKPASEPQISIWFLLIRPLPSQQKHIWLLLPHSQIDNNDNLDHYFLSVWLISLNRNMGRSQKGGVLFLVPSTPSTLVDPSSFNPPQCRRCHNVVCLRLGNSILGFQDYSIGNIDWKVENTYSQLITIPNYTIHLCLHDIKLN